MTRVSTVRRWFWTTTLGGFGLLSLPLFGVLCLFVDSFRQDGHIGWYHALPRPLHFLHPPFYYPEFYFVTLVLGLAGFALGRSCDRVARASRAELDKDSV